MRKNLVGWDARQVLMLLLLYGKATYNLIVFIGLHAGHVTGCCTSVCEIATYSRKS